MPRKVHQPHLSTVKDARVVRTRQVLRDTLLKLLKRNLLEDITIRDICSAANVGYVTFLRHYPTKEALLNTIAEEEAQRLIEASVSTLNAFSVHEACVSLCTYVHQNRALWKILFKSGANRALRDELIRLSAEFATHRAQPHAWLPANIGISLAIGGTLELINCWLQQKKPLSINQVAEIQDRLVISPITNQSPPLLPEGK